jgi:hypothetical protein
MRVRFQTRPAPDGAHYPSLTLGAEYEVLGISADWFRLLNDRGEPILYDAACFQVVDATEPENWVSKVEDGVRYAYPPGWGSPGFFEDWHDGVPEVRRQFADDLARWFPATSRQV